MKHPMDARRKKKLLTNTYHVVVSDLDMPNLSGEELLAWIRATPPHKDIPFLMVSASHDMVQRRGCLCWGFSVCDQPLTVQELSRHITAVLPPHISSKYGLYD